ncbi:hypothetical protein H2201_006419 [Coniosporium apollinis]|uniref:WHIM1 domain-containing protein n=1 Tax=Coniosporium apollinis TaxID=61459 RepID=A0ABQ9NMA2_9PEZI|nr:hypothetical protein H2201_006419 [Coniosporium apollinis]
MSDSESSALSSPPGSDDELSPVPEMMPDLPAFKAARHDTSMSPPPDSTPKRKRPASPPHEEVLADNPDIAFIVMFRSRFSEAFPPKLIHYGPQDIERGVADALPTPQIESLLCALLGLALNRKKYVERGHYGRALEEAISAHKSQWPRAWGGVNPISGGRSFNTMSPQERLTLLKTLIIWSLHGSETILNIIKESYKQSRKEDDINQPLSVQPWGRDGDKRRYWLVEGRDDTNFRLYRESNPALKHNTWRSVAGTIDELKAVAERLNEDGAQASRRLAEMIMRAVPRFEATEEKRKRREYRQVRKSQFARAEPGFSLYEGRTRGKRMKYTFSDEEDEASDATSTRRSTRQSGTGTPAELSRPTVTASGRQIRSRVGGAYGESLLSGQATTDRQSPATGDYAHSEASEDVRPQHGRSTRSGGAKPAVNGRGRSRRNIDTYNSLDEMEDEDDAASTGNEWNSEDNANDADDAGDDEGDEDMDDEAEEEERPQSSLVVRLRYRKSPAAIKLLSPEPPSDPNAERDIHKPPPTITAAQAPTNGHSHNTTSAHSSSFGQPNGTIDRYLSKPQQPPTHNPYFSAPPAATRPTVSGIASVAQPFQGAPPHALKPNALPNGLQPGVPPASGTQYAQPTYGQS